MRFLVDECTGTSVANFLRNEGHDVFSIFDQARGADDDAVLQRAVAEDRILITNDKDFGDKVFRDRHPHKGIVLLRLDDERAAPKVEVIRQLLANYAAQLPGQFVVVTEKQVRFARSGLP